MDLVALLEVLDSFASVSILLVVLWFLSKGILRTRSEIELLKEQMQARIDEIREDRDFYRNRYNDAEEIRQDRDWYRERLSKSTTLLGNLLSTVEVEESES